MSVAPPLPVAAPTAVGNLFGPVVADLEQVERVFADELQSELPFVQELVLHLAHYRGKRLRPALLLLAARACGQVTADHHILGAVVEMIHTATLVHDDVLDHADVRRHVATINRRWGNSASVLLGDWLFTHAFYLASTTGSALACQLIGSATNRVCAGELQQVGERGNLDLGETDYFRIIDGKTAELTACACRLGAAFADADEDVVESLARFGRALGIAFQIADDLLDLVGKEQEAGKSLGTDLEQQKLTLPLIYLMQNSGPETVQRIRQVLAGAGNHKRHQLMPALVESGALTYATRRAEQYAADARRELHCLPPSECRDVLEYMTHLVVHRSA